MLTADCKVSWGTSRPLSALTDLLQARQKWLKESAKDAVIATAIDVMVSLRALTRSAKNKRSSRPVVVRRADLDASYYGGRRSPRRTLRTAGGARFAAKRVKWFSHGIKDADLKVYLVKPEHAQVKPYLVVAENVSRAKEFERKASVRRMRQYGNLAKWAFGVSMNKLSTRNVHDNVTGEARQAGSRLSFVWKGGDDRVYEVAMSDRLDYAADALRGGIGAVDMACMKTANKVAGRLMHRFGDMLGPDFRTPFPEVMRAR